MNKYELKAERVRQNKSTDYMARVIGKTADCYAKKENGKVKFTPDEICAITNDLSLTFDMFNTIFFDGNLPISKLPKFSCSVQ